MEQVPSPANITANTGPSRLVAALLANLEPRRWAGEYVFNCVANIDDIDPSEHVAMLREAEGWTLITQRSAAQRQGRPSRESYTAITLEVNSALSDVGLTAAVSRVLAEAGVACNILAGVHHDHLFIPITQGDRALALLAELQRANRAISRSTNQP